MGPASVRTIVTGSQVNGSVIFGMLSVAVSTFRGSPASDRAEWSPALFVRLSVFEAG